MPSTLAQDTVVAPAQTGIRGAFSALFPRTSEKFTEWSEKAAERSRQMVTPGWQYFRKVLIFLVLFFVFGLAYQIVIQNNPEEWNTPKDDNGNTLINGWYFSGIVMSTTGYGDYYPLSKRGMILIMVNALLSWIVFNALLN